MGILSWFKSWLYYYLLKYIWPSRKRHIGEFKDILDDIHASGFISTAKEWKTDKPKQTLTDDDGQDEISFYGGNSLGDKLWVQFSCRPDDKGEVNVFLHLEGVGSYILDRYPETSVFHTDKNTFSGAGLKLTCLSAFRKWRISFNGRLRELNTKESSSVHVRFSFTWTPTSILHEIGAETSLKLAADYLANQSFANFILKANKIMKRIECYDQCGMTLGTVTISGQEEKEVQLWGHRQRNRSIYNETQLNNKTKYYGMLNKGDSLSTGAVTVSDNQLQFGYFHKGNRVLTPLVSTSIKLDNTHFLSKHAVLVNHGQGNQRWELDSLQEIVTHHGQFSSRIQFGPITTNGYKGHGYVQRFYRNKETPRKNPLRSIPRPISETSLSSFKTVPSVVAFEDDPCQCSEVTGGKGCSLALLKKISDASKNFIVPRGLVLTTVAYQKHLKNNNFLNTHINQLQSALKENNISNIELQCTSVSNEFLKTKLAEDLKKELHAILNRVFGKNLDAIRFAVRSSAIGEDSEETSAAGQMQTLLGVRGLDQVCEAVCKCWASQFQLTAVQYKKQNGMELNPGMAVVVQEMVAAEIAGVTFTCDPVTGDPGYITITANYGLGESVVSATSEPDTVTLERSSDNSLSIKNVMIGRKDVLIRMDEHGGTLEEEISQEDKAKSCLSDILSLKIGKLAVEIEQAFNSPRDLEWAVIDNTVYLLQSRPVTTLHKDTVYDLTHELDVSHISEFEDVTKANLGEVMPGATTPLTVSVFHKFFDVHILQLRNKKLGNYFIPNPMSAYFFVSSSGHLMFNLYDFLLKIIDPSGKLSYRAWEIALFGRLLEDEYIQKGIERNGYAPEIKISSLAILWMAYRNSRDIDYYENNMPTINVSKCKTSKEAYDTFIKKAPGVIKLLPFHYQQTEASSFFSMFVIQNIADFYDNDINEILKDLSLLLSKCSDIESADVPAAIERLVAEISSSKSAKEFIEMDTKVAAKFLQDSKDKVGKSYTQFISRHSHRCLKEFDFISAPWGENQETLVSILQTMVRNKKSNVGEDRPYINTWNSLDMIKYKPTFLKKLKLWYYAKCSRFGVKIREAGKSLLIRSVNEFRKPMRHIANLLVQEGKLTDPFLLYYLTFEEIGFLVEQNTPALVNKARQRRKLWLKLEKEKYPEISRGIPKPLSSKKNTLSNGTTSQTLKGITVSQGVAQGIARVIINFEECSTIQQDDILITYCTDIGWSPYFPLLSGVVTELGGLVSHGAVVAREYGLPCLVGVQGATDCFKSGDHVILDATKGVLKKVEIKEA